MSVDRPLEGLTIVCGITLKYEKHSLMVFSFFFFNDTATTEIYTLSLHDALPISLACQELRQCIHVAPRTCQKDSATTATERSEEHTSELQSRLHLVCRLLLEKKKNSHPGDPCGAATWHPAPAYPQPALKRCSAAS